MPFNRSAWAGALLITVVAGAWMWRTHQASSVDSAQLEEWQAMVAQAMEPGALRHLRELADSGSVPAQSALGEALLSAQDGVLHDEGMRWLEAAAPRDVRAQRLLGKVYLLGTDGMTRDYPRALGLLRQAAEHNDGPAAYYLGLIYRSGYGTGVDKQQAAQWFDRAAQQGIAVAMFMLANAYRAGDGVPQDEARALALYQEAAEHELPQAVQTLAMAYQNGELGLKRDEAAFHQQWLETAHSLKHPALAP
jgi:TPR repeat protein